MTRLVVAVVTDMQEPRVCVACLTSDGHWVRPGPPFGTLTEDRIASGKSFLSPGDVIRLRFTPKRPAEPPHTEDCVCDMPSHERMGALEPAEFRDALGTSLVASVADGFGGHLVGRAVPPGASCSSLVTVRASSAIVRVDYQGTPKFRLHLNDGREWRREIPVRDLRLMRYLGHRNARGAEVETHVLNARLKTAKETIVCLGLTRPWARPGEEPRCWLQVNGVFTFPEDFLAGHQWHEFATSTSTISAR
jgi:hypothetical protein